MDIFSVILLGFLQGSTEFLPVSSSGHLFLLETWLGVEPNLSLEVWLHGASLLAVLIFFRKKIGKLFIGFWNLIRFPKQKDREGILASKLLVATLCTIPVAVFFAENVFHHTTLSVQLVAVTLIITGGLILTAEKTQSLDYTWKPKWIQDNDFGWWSVVLVGLMQGISVIPGISRSGLTIAVLIFLGVRRRLAAEISFLLAIPTISGALVSVYFGLGSTNGAFVFNPTWLLGGVVCFLVAWGTIGWMLKLVEHKWIYFAPYCIGVGGLLLLLFS
jgi:undecaprenyl-diphosphatase